MNKDYIETILYELDTECERALDKIKYNNEDFKCDCCLEVKTIIIRIQELQEMLEEELS